jgi:hypothetical protein
VTESSDTGSRYDSQVLQAQLAEYLSTRDEVISSISNQHLVLTFGTAAISGVFVAGCVMWDRPPGSLIFFSIPPIVVWVLMMWLAEVARMLRSVAFCREQDFAI